MTGAWTLTPAPPSPGPWTICQPTCLDSTHHPRPSIPPKPPKLHVAVGAAGRGTSEPTWWLGPQGSAAPAPGKGGCFFFQQQKHKVLMPFCTRRGQASALSRGSSAGPHLSVTAPVLASRGPQGQQNSGTHSHLSPQHPYPWEGNMSVLGQPASGPSGPDKAGVRSSSWLWAEALPPSPLHDF